MIRKIKLNEYGDEADGVFLHAKQGGVKELIQKAVAAAQNEGVPYYILGGGTNVLAADNGFDGLVIKVLHQNIEVYNDSLFADAGISMGVLVHKAKALGLSSLEWAAGLPGTLGGAIYGNAGSCGGQTADVINTVEIFDPESLEVKEFSNTECNFEYRGSLFKTQPAVILGAALQLKKGDPLDIMKTMAENLKFRAEHQPLSNKSEGCVFKNIDVAQSQAARDLVHLHQDFSLFKDSKYIPTGYLIDKAGLKGLRIGGVEISDKHGNFIVCHDNALSEDILWIISIVKEKISNEFDIQLTEEVQLLWNKY